MKKTTTILFCLSVFFSIAAIALSIINSSINNSPLPSKDGTPIQSIKYINSAEKVEIKTRTLEDDLTVYVTRSITSDLADEICECELYSGEDYITTFFLRYGDTASYTFPAGSTLGALRVVEIPSHA